MLFSNCEVLLMCVSVVSCIIAISIIVTKVRVSVSNNVWCGGLHWPMVAS